MLLKQTHVGSWTHRPLCAVVCSFRSAVRPCRRDPGTCFHAAGDVLSSTDTADGTRNFRDASYPPSASSSTASSPAPAPTSTASSSEAGPSFNFVCPICLQTPFSVEHMPTRRLGMCCSRCSRTFQSDARFVDLTLTSGLQATYEQKSWAGTEMFRSPLVSFAYERGWRQGFAWAGFPGVDKEYAMAMEYLRPAYGSTLVDMSCGSGLFTRKFAASGQFQGVIAADFSESMLQQTQAYLRTTNTTATSATPVVLLRADVGRLPFATASVSAIHAGAAIHCWPNPQAALAEISRVLAPGGVFVASTFLLAAAPLGEVFGDESVRLLHKLAPENVFRSAYRFWEEGELRELCGSVGLETFTRDRSWRFIMFKATKPLNSQPEEQE